MSSAFQHLYSIMVRTCVSVGLFLFLTSWLQASEADSNAPRTWVDSTGKFQIQAKLLRFEDGKVFIQRTSDSKELAIPYSALSQQDQGFLKKLMGKQENPYRAWSDKTGQFQIQAQLVKSTNGVIHLKRIEDGQEISVPLEGLSQADKDFVQARLSSKAAGVDSDNPAQSTQAEPGDLESHAKLLLKEYCIRCHGSDAQKGGLRLDSRGGALGGGDSGRVLVPGNAEKSLIYQLVILDKDHLYRMPPKGPLLTARQQVVIKEWIDSGAPFSGQLQEEDANGQSGGPVDSSYRGQLRSNPALVKQHSDQVDTLMELWFRREGEKKGRLVTDNVFLRRAYLDIIGRIPSLPEYNAFMSSRHPDKREELVNSLLDTPAYDMHTLQLWLNALRVKPTDPKFNSEIYMVWLRNAIQENMPYDEFVSVQMIQAGEFFGTEASIDYKDLPPFPELATSSKAKQMLLKREGMKEVDFREDFANWATSPDNHMFNKTVVNRLWARVFGVPLVGGLTDLSEREVGPNPRLTAYLIQFMKRIQYDPKLFLEVLFKTDTYQREAFPIPAPDEMPMGAPVVKRLSPKQINDSILTLRVADPDKLVAQVSMSGESLMPLELDNLASASSFLGVFSKNELQTIDDSTQETPNLGDPKDMRQFKDNTASELATRLRDAGELNAQTITWAYNAILARRPTPKELEQASQHLAESQDPMPDLVWFLLNTAEFKLKP